MNLLEIHNTDRQTNGFKVLDGTDALESICFPVSQKPLHYLIDRGGYHKTEYKGLVRDDTGEILYVGKEYSPVANEEIVKAMEPLMNDGFELRDIRVYQDRRFQINLWNPNEKLDINEEEANLRVTFGNSYDGSLAFYTAIGAYIQVCGNGMIAGKGFSFRKKHTGISDLSSFMLECVSSRDKIINMLKAKQWQDLEKDKLLKLFDKITKNLPDGKDKKPNPVKVLLNKQFENEMSNYANSEFALFMAVTNIATHGHQLGISPTYQMELESQSTVFFTN
jgi:hypothetical protein